MDTVLPNISILVIDDEPEIRRFLGDVLSQKGYETHVIGDGAEAIAEIEKKNFDIVIADFRLPGVSGIEVIERAKQKDRYCEAILITGHPTAESAANACKIDVLSYLLKPISLFDLLSQVERARAQRLFYLRTRFLAGSTQEEDLKKHAMDMLSINEFARGLSCSLDIETIVQLILLKMKKDLCLHTTGLFFNGPEGGDLYLYNTNERVAGNALETLKAFVKDQWHALHAKPELALDRISVLPVGSPASGDAADVSHTVFVPMMTMGSYVGLLFGAGNGVSIDNDRLTENLHVISNVSAPVLDNAYHYRKAELMASVDSLTGVHNHRSFHEHLVRELSSSRRHQRPLTLAIFDVDNFKTINDTYGHQIGDKALKYIAGTVKALIRKEDFFARYGGDEFAIVFSHSEYPWIRLMAERICKQMADQPFAEGKLTVPITLSMGLNYFDGIRSVTKDEFIEGADQTLYRAKRTGKNKVCMSEF